MKYSIIIISYENFSSTTGQLVDYLLPSKSKYEVEVILFDNGSSAETLTQIKLLTGTDGRLKVICNQKNSCNFLKVHGRLDYDQNSKRAEDSKF